MVNLGIQCYNGDMSINFLSILCHHFAHNEFSNYKFHSDLFFSKGLLCFISYSEHLSAIYNNKNYGSLPYILFTAVQNS